jgi:hypothetical protein
MGSSPFATAFTSYYAGLLSAPKSDLEKARKPGRAKLEAYVKIHPRIIGECVIARACTR